jgi:hypothetical protein
MKNRKNMYQTLGIVFIILNIFLSCFFVFYLKSRYLHLNFTFILLPVQLLLIPGLLFIIAAYREQQKINRQKRQAMESAFAD